MYRFKKILVNLSKVYTLDLRALALMRICIGLIVITDLCIRGSYLTAHYTDDGIWPSNLIYNFGWKAGFWSLHALKGSYIWELILFSIHAVFAVALILGYKTKISTLIVWLLTISLHNRNLFVQQSGDDLLRMVLFWGLFLPWNRCYSIDSKNKALNTKPIIMANIGYLLLIASVYFFSVALKTSLEWYSEGSAIYYALSLEQLRLPVGDFLYRFPILMKYLTFFVFYIELIIPILILWPAKKGYLRFTAFLLIILLHLGIGSTLYVGLFFVIGMASSFGLLPKFALDKLESTFKLKKDRSILIKQKHNAFKWFTNTSCAIAIFLCLLINLSTTNWFSYELRSELNYPVNFLRLDQYWGMFSPSVLKKDGWFVYYGMDSIGRQWDLRLNQDYVDFKKPAHIISMYKTDRWRKLAENMQNDKFDFLRPLYGKYILHSWNIRHPEKKILTLNLYYMEKESLPDYKTTEIKKRLFSVCSDN